jgi:hypothetical protein
MKHSRRSGEHENIRERFPKGRSAGESESKTRSDYTFSANRRGEISNAIGKKNEMDLRRGNMAVSELLRLWNWL